MTFQYHPESERSMFSWDDLAVSSSWYPDSFLLKCRQNTTFLWPCCALPVWATSSPSRWEQLLYLHENRCSWLETGTRKTHSKLSTSAIYWRRLMKTETRRLFDLEKGGCARRMASDCEHGHVYPDYSSQVVFNVPRITRTTRICAAEMAVRYAALSACRKVHVCHCNSLGGATWRYRGRKNVTDGNHNGTDGRTDRRTDGQTECDAICGPLLGRRAA